MIERFRGLFAPKWDEGGDGGLSSPAGIPRPEAAPDRSQLRREEVKGWLNRLNALSPHQDDLPPVAGPKIDAFIFRDDGSVDFNGDLSLRVMNMSLRTKDEEKGTMTVAPARQEEFRELLRTMPAIKELFGSVYLDNNDELIDRLPPLPETIHGSVDLSHTFFRDLKGLPKRIDGDLILKYTLLDSLDGLAGTDIGGVIVFEGMRKARDLSEQASAMGYQVKFTSVGEGQM